MKVSEEERVVRNAHKRLIVFMRKLRKYLTDAGHKVGTCQTVLFAFGERRFTTIESIDGVDIGSSELSINLRRSGGAWNTVYQDRLSISIRPPDWLSRNAPRTKTFPEPKTGFDVGKIAGALLEYVARAKAIDKTEKAGERKRRAADKLFKTAYNSTRDLLHRFDGDMDSHDAKRVKMALLVTPGEARSLLLALKGMRE